MKQLTVLIISLFLLSLGSCATTTPKKTESAPAGLSGEWQYSGVIKDCNGDRTESWIAIITQTGDVVTLKHEFGTLTGEKEGNEIYFEDFVQGQLTINAAVNTVNAEGNRIVGKGVEWSYGGCKGVSDVTFERKN